mmetsp:Transcript_30521/g.66972  ORF Transcript_30521/g.66972 Transcript_30521/m.66972 type:complete len:686 (+) Transcript_30521:106-2163(+)
MRTCAAALFVGLSEATRDHPITRIVKLIEDFKVKAEEEGQEEEISYTKFERWCKNSKGQLDGDIKKSKDTLAKASEEKKQLEATIAKMSEDSERLQGEIDDRNSAQAKADEARTEENKEYVAEQGDLSDTITAMDEAIAALEQGKADAATATALQVKASVRRAVALVEVFMSDSQRQQTQAFLQSSSSFLQVDPPARSKYDFKGDKIIELFEGMKRDFENKKFESEKAEMNAKAHYDLAKKAQTQAITAAETSKTKKDNRKSSAEGDLADVESTISTTESTLSADETTHENTSSTCEQRAREWAERSKTRAGEMKAMDMAIKILKKSAHVRAPDAAHAQADPSSFIQLSAAPKPHASEAVALLKKAASKYQGLSRLVVAAEALAAPPGHGKNSGGPFHKVKQQIQKMIFQLQDEQKQEQEHKDWCDHEVTNTKQKEEEFTKRETKLDNALDELTANIELLDTEVADHNTNVKDLNADIAELKADRAEDSKENAIDIKDAQEAQTAIANAQHVLTDFYKGSGEVAKEDWEFLQELPAEPDTWDASYTGTNGGSSQILGMLESIASDFAQMEIQARVAESTNQKEFDATLEDLEVNKANHEEKARLKTNKLDSLQKKVSAKSEQLDNVKDQLYAADEYHKSLRPACYGDSETYEEVQPLFEARQQARDTEINMLRDAQKILDEAFNK